MNRAEAIKKIQKCLRLSRSANEHEAAAALRQAQALMREYGVSDMEMEAAQASERAARSGAKTPTHYEAALAAKVAGAFGCQTIFATTWMHRGGEWRFIGCGAAPEIAQYAFTVLVRQLRRARAEYIRTKLARCKTTTRTRRADLFCDGWVIAVTRQLAAIFGSELQASAIEAYMTIHYPQLKDMAPRDRNDRNKMGERAYDDLASGHRAGREAQLNRGVGTELQQRITQQ